MNPVFLDTVGLLALWDSMTNGTPQRKECLRISFGYAPLITTSFVLFECATAAARRPYRLVVAELRQTLELSGGLITRMVRTSMWLGTRIVGAAMEPELSIMFHSSYAPAGPDRCVYQRPSFRTAGLVPSF